MVDIAPHGHLRPLHYRVHFFSNSKSHAACLDKTTTNPSQATVCPKNHKVNNYTMVKTNCYDETNKMSLSNVILESSQDSPHGEFYIWLEPCTLGAGNCVKFLDRLKQRLAIDAYLLSTRNDKKIDFEKFGQFYVSLKGIQILVFFFTKLPTEEIFNICVKFFFFFLKNGRTTQTKQFFQFFVVFLENTAFFARIANEKFLECYFRYKGYINFCRNMLLSSQL